MGPSQARRSAATIWLRSASAQYVAFGDVCIWAANRMFSPLHMSREAQQKCTYHAEPEHGASTGNEYDPKTFVRNGWKDCGSPSS